MQPGDGFIANDNHARPGQERRNQLSGAGHQAGANNHVIAALAQRNMDLFLHHSLSSTSGRVASASSTRSTICSIEACPSDCTARSAFS